ncbi:MAG: SusC/RagA family TonB-linked outer membrane protein [Bacteroidaceae bacterium]|nr:SusC/RagA family TonB-linked outer membrane protein [Bacteroidaceae bacterium]
MKDRISNTILHKALSTSLCFILLSGLSIGTASAQDNNENEENATRIYAKKRTQTKEYEMKTVEGVITDDATGEAMGGVRVQAYGLENYSVLTDEDGSYKIEIPTFSDALYVTVEGYQPQQIAVKDGKADGKLISTHFNSFYTEATTITSQRTLKLDETSGITFENDLENKMAADVHAIKRNGVPGMGVYMNIRGVNSINANSQPLIVLDGNIIDPQYDRTTLHEGFYSNLLSGIDPENIESVQVLKNGTALYGAKGANGVIIITTKRGKSMATKIGVRIYGGVELTPKKLDVLNGDEYSTYLFDVASTVKDFKVSNINSYRFLDKSPSNYYLKVFTNNTDWQKDMYRTAMTQNYKINVEGGDEIGMYALSLGYAKGESIGKGTDMDRLNLRFNTDIKVFSKVSTGLDIAFNQNTYNVLDNGWSEDYSMQNIGSTNVLGLIQAPFISPYAYYYDETSTDPLSSNRLALSKEYSGKYAASGGTWIQNPFRFSNSLNTNSNRVNEALRNPYWILKNGRGNNKNHAQFTQMDLNVSPKYEINKHLSISDRFNYSLVRSNEKYFLPIAGTTAYFLEDLGDITSVVRTQFGKETTMQNDLRIDWNNIYGAHAIDVFAGWRYNNYSYSYNFMGGYNNENDKLPNVSKNMQYVNYGGTNDNWIDITYYLNAAYNYKQRYFAEFTLSSQAASRFGDNTDDGFQLAGVSWGVFPSLQLGWVLTNEKWFQTGKGIQYLKLTAGVDQSGNDDLDYYAARTYWESQRVTKNTVGLVLKNIENSTIQWETTTKYNVALQGSFLNNRLQAGLDLFWHKTDNLLTIKQLSYISGMDKYWTNDGQMKNKGFEASVNAAIINKKNWKWEAGLSVGHYNNKVTKLPENNTFEIKDVDGGNRQTINGYTSDVFGDANVLTAVGHAMGSFYGWQTNGVFASDGEASQATTVTRNGNNYLKYPTGLTEAGKEYYNFQAGDVKFIDRNNDGVIDDADKTVIGNPNPDIYGNIFTSLTWKHLRLDVNFKYSLGNDIYNYQRSIIEGLNTTYNQSKATLRRWTHENHVTDMPKVCYTYSDDWRNNERMSDRWIEDGSYLKLKNVRLTYKLPYSNTWLMGLKLWGEANNLFTVTRYLGTDPEMSHSNNVLYQGIDTGLIPSGRSFNVGVSINL